MHFPDKLYTEESQIATILELNNSFRLCLNHGYISPRSAVYMLVGSKYFSGEENYGFS